MIYSHNAIMFHHFTDQKIYPEGEGAITSEEFEKILIESKKFKVIDANDWYYKYVSGTLTQNEMCLTFDDNLKCQIEIALPLLDKYKIKAFWFIYTSPFEGEIPYLELFRWFRLKKFNSAEEFYERFIIYCSKLMGEKINIGLENFIPNEFLIDFPFYSMADRKFRFIRDHILTIDEYKLIMFAIMKDLSFNWNDVISNLSFNTDDLKMLSKKGHIIGLHSHTHPTNIAKLPLEDQITEYEINKNIIKEITGENVSCVAHPVNSYDDNTLKILSDMGIKIGFRSNAVLVDYKKKLELPRIDHTEIIKKLAI